MSGVTRAPLVVPVAEQHRPAFRRAPLASASGTDYVIAGGDVVDVVDVVTVVSKPAFNDVATAADVKTLERVLVRRYDDAATAAENFSFETDELIHDGVSATDAATTALARFVAHDDAVAANDAFRVTSGNTYDDTVIAVDGRVVLLQHERRIDETLGAEDDFGFGNYVKIRVDETPTGADVYVKTRTLSRVRADGVEADDDAVAGRAFEVDFEDAADAADSTDQVFGFTVGKSDTTTAADAATLALVTALRFADAAAPTDAKQLAAAYARTYSDAATAVDSATPIHAIVLAAQADSVGATDAVVVSINRQVRVNDVVAVHDVATGSAVPHIVPISPLAGQRGVAPDVNIVFDILEGLGNAIIAGSVTVRVEGAVVWTAGVAAGGWAGMARPTPASNGLRYTLHPPEGFAYGEDVDVQVSFYFGSIMPATSDVVTASDAFTVVAA